MKPKSLQLNPKKKVIISICMINVKAVVNRVFDPKLRTNMMLTTTTLTESCILCLLFDNINAANNADLNVDFNECIYKNGTFILQ